MQPSRIDLFKKVIAMDPEDAVSHYGLGLEYLKEESYAEAAESFRTAIRLQPDYSAAYRELGKALTGLGQKDEAIRTYEAGIPIAERNGDLQTVKEMRVFLKRLTTPGD